MKNLICSFFLFSAVFLLTNSISAQSYNNAASIRLAWRFGGTCKHFFNEKIAAEGIVNFPSRGTFGCIPAPPPDLTFRSKK